MAVRLTCWVLKIGVFAFLLAGCQTGREPENADKKNDADYVLVRAPATDADRYTPGAYKPTYELANGKLGPDLVGVWQYGLLSADEYIEDDQRTNRLTPECEFTSRYAQRWQRLPQFSHDQFDYETPRGRIVTGGFSYGVWQDTSARNPARVAIVFRGTNFIEPADWYSNARWITRFNPVTLDQYQQTRELTDELVPALQEEFGDNVEIVAAGHSLGGGLAQNAGYSSAAISKVYAFASSPVVGYRDLDPRNTDRNKEGLKIYRINESGEIMAAGRWIHRNTAGLSWQNPQATELLLSFRSAFYKPGSSGDDPISQHSIAALSCSMICHIERGYDKSICYQNTGKRD